MVLIGTFAFIINVQIRIHYTVLVCRYRCMWWYDNEVVWFVLTGVDLSNIVKAVPKVSSEENTEDQTHEVLQV